MTLTPTLADRLKVLPQYLIPQHWLARRMHRLTQMQGGALSQWAITWFIKAYQVDMQSAQQTDVHDYTSFNAFFTRALQPSARPLAPCGLACPVDGRISQFGHVCDGQLLQAKGHYYTLSNLLGGNESLASRFKDSRFATLYLSPRDYHRIHMPLTGRLTDMIYVPGRLFGVGGLTVRTVPDLFARNERLICVFETAQGPMALVMVGAIFVGSLETVWAGKITPPHGRQIQHWQYPAKDAPNLLRGMEMGRFNMGSTVIFLPPANHGINWLSSLHIGQSIRMGEALDEMDVG